jgi:PPOX class probable F420-dependent enzyme
VIFASGSDDDRRALERLGTDMVAWLASVTPDGQPQTLPIWFLWEDGEITIYSDHRAKRNANIAANPRVSLHLNDNGKGGDVVIVEGEARIDPGAPTIMDNPAYLRKYGEWIRSSFGSPESMHGIYNVVIRITPTRGRASRA